MRAHSKNYILDNSIFQNILKGENYSQESISPTPLTPLKDKLNPSIILSNNGSMIKYKENDIISNGESLKTLMLTPEHLRYSPQQNIEYHGNQEYANMLTDINSLNLELNKMRIKEQKYLGRISVLEKDKHYLMNLLSQSEYKLQESISKSKEENKRVNLIIESFRNSLTTMNNKIQESSKNKVCEQTQTDESLNLEAEKNYFLVGHISMLKNKLDILDGFGKDVINENNKLKEELARTLSNFNNIRTELNVFKFDQKSENNLKEIYEKHQKQIEIENNYFKCYVRSISDLGENESNIAAPSFEKYKASKKNQPIQKISTNNNPIPAYLKVISLSSAVMAVEIDH